MEFLKEISGWKSIRRFKDEMVPFEKIKAVLDAARRAPSWENYQPWHFVVITNPEVKSILKNLTGGQSFVAKAPVVICACADLQSFSIEKARIRITELLQAITGKEPSEDFIDEKYLSSSMMTPAKLGNEIIFARALEQLSYAVSFMILEASNQGLGSCVVGAFGNMATHALPELYDEFIRKLNLPDHVIPLVLIPLGFPDEEPKLRPRKSFNDICHNERFGEKFTA